MATILDAGALIAVDRRSDSMAKLLADVAQRGETVRVPTAVVAQVWRDGARQARLARALSFMAECGLDNDHARSIGGFLRNSSTSDIVDASVVDLAEDGDTVITSDPDDVAHLANSIGRRVRVLTI
jgi:hypothetical protein